MSVHTHTHTHTVLSLHQKKENTLVGGSNYINLSHNIPSLQMKIKAYMKGEKVCPGRENKVSI